jgi:ABC-type transport system involved in multi-copper enzyme maturation permease subunit
MSVATTTITPALPVRTATTTTTNASRILKGEWTKLRTLPSTWRTAAFAFVFSVATGVVLVVSQAGQWATMTPAQHQSFDATSCSLFGIMIGAVLLGSLALRSVTAEYATGMIRSTFTAMPARRLVLAGKAAVVAAFAFPVALASDFVGFELGQRIFAGKHLQVSLGHPGVPAAIVFGAVAVSLVAVIAVGLGGVIRHTAGATTALAVVIVGGVTFGQLLPAAWRGYLPGTAIQSAVTVHRSPGLLTPGTAIVVLGIYAAITLAAASIRAAHRDA